MALAIAVAVHAALLLVRIDGAELDGVTRPSFLRELIPLADTTTIQLMPYVAARPRADIPPPGPLRRDATTTPDEAPPDTPPPVELARPDLERDQPPTDEPPAQLRRRGGGLQPSLGGGVLWVRPLPLPPAELAARLRQKSHTELVDSAVQSIVQEYLDSLAKDPAVVASGPPAWVGKVGGKEFGLDGRNIIVAGLRIPAAILGFLPLSLGGGVADPNRATRRLNDMREDLMRAAERSENYAQFKESIRDIRERKQAEKDFQRNQRSTPPELQDSVEMMQ